MKQKTGRIGLLIVAIIWGSGFVASAIALNSFAPTQILALRFTLAFLISLLVFRKDIKEIKVPEIKKGGAIGVFLFLAFLFQTIGLQYTTASKNAFLTATNIVIVPFLSWVILRKKVSRNSFLGALVTLVGIGFLSGDGLTLGSINLGDALTLVCAIFFALQIFYTDFFVKDIKPGIIMIAQMGTAAMLSWVTVFFSSETTFYINGETILPILYLGIISTLLAYGIQTWSQKYVGSSESAVILSTEAFFGMMASVIILNEQITTPMIIGAALIFIGILIVEIKPSNKNVLTQEQIQRR